MYFDGIFRPGGENCVLPLSFLKKMLIFGFRREPFHFLSITKIYSSTLIHRMPSPAAKRLSGSSSLNDVVATGPSPVITRLNPTAPQVTQRTVTWAKSVEADLDDDPTAAAASNQPDHEDDDATKIVLEGPFNGAQSISINAAPQWILSLPFVGPLVGAFGLAPVFSVSLIFFAVRGILVQATASARLPYFRNTLGITDSADFQRYYSIPVFAWAAKPGIGLLSDIFPFLGYRKRGYMALSSVGLVISTVILATLPTPTDGDSRTRAAMFTSVMFFIANAGMATLDLLTEGTYAEWMKRRRDTGSSLVSWAFGFSMVGGVVTVAFVGPLADAGWVRLILWICVPTSFVTVFPSVFNWFREPRVCFRTAIVGGGEDTSDADVTDTSTGSHSGVVAAARMRDIATLNGEDDDNDDNSTRNPSGYATVDSSDPEEEPDEDDPATLNASAANSSMIVDKLVSMAQPYLKGELSRPSNVRIIFFALLVTMTAITNALASLLFGPTVRVAWMVSSVALLSMLSFKWLPAAVAAGNMFMFLNQTLYIQIPGALDYFYTADESCVPDGPHFDYTFYQTYTGVIGYLAGVLGVIAFERVLAKKRYMTVFCVTISAKIFASTFDIILAARWNKTHLGMSDKSIYVWGDTVVYQAAMMLDFMPAVVLTSRLCPSGMEAIMYALLAGFSNFGQTLSMNIGEALIPLFGIVSTPPHCDFSRLPQLILFCHCIVPLVALPLSWLLLPPKRLDEPLDNGSGSRTARYRAAVVRRRRRQAIRRRDDISSVADRNEPSKAEGSA